MRYLFAEVILVWAGKKLIKTPPVPEYLDGIFSRIAALLTCDLRVGFLRRYQKQLNYDHRFLNIRGLRTQGTYTLELLRVFVHLRITGANPSDPQKELLATSDQEDKGEIWDILLNDVRAKRYGVAWVILGKPGCGKTTLLQHITLVLTSNRRHSFSFPARVPILLFIRDHVASITMDKTPNLAELINSFYNDPKRYPGLMPPEKWFQIKLEKGRCLVLLDGLDEVGDCSDRIKVSAWVDEQVRLYPRSLFILTSRPQGYQSAPLARAHTLEVLPFNHEQVKMFVNNWYLANEVIAYGHKEDAGVRQKARTGAEDLMYRLSQSVRLRDLTVNPLLLSMVAMVHRYRGQLPGRRVELYAEICDVLLGHWRKARGVADSLTPSQRRVVLQPLAAAMMERRVREISTKDAMNVIAEPLGRINLLDQEALDFLKDTEASSGLITESEIGEWRFAHLTFQEYLAACHYTEFGFSMTLAELIKDSWWEETLRLYSSQRDASELMRTCLIQKGMPALVLAVDLLNEAKQIDVDLRREAEMLLRNDLDSVDYERRKLAAEVALTRRLRNSWQLVDDRREADYNLVTTAEYALFLADTSLAVSPAHWCGSCSPQGEGEKPVLGVTAYQANAFIEWLNKHQGGQFHYRLPDFSEVQYLDNNNKDEAYWISKNKGYAIACSHELNLFFSERCQEFSQLPIHLSFDFSNIHDIELTPASDFGRDISLARGFGHDLERAINIARARSLTCDISLDYINSRVRDIELVLKETDCNATSQPFEKSMDSVERWQSLLSTCMNILCTQRNNKNDRWIAWWQYISVLADWSYITCQQVELDQQTLLGGRSRWFGRKNKGFYSEGKEIFLNLHWYSIVVSKRIAGNLPSWEGIRLVRERVQ